MQGTHEAIAAIEETAAIACPLSTSLRKESDRMKLDRTA